MHIDDRLLEWATPRQREYIEAVERHGSARAAAAALGVNKSTVTESISGLKARAAKMGYSPEHDMTRAVPEGFSVRGVSTYYDSEGNARGQWVKSKADDVAREAALKAAYAALASELPRIEPIAGPAVGNVDLCTLYTLTDAHIGALAWHREGGADWDLGIAESTIVGCFEEAIRSAPASQTAILNQLGDLLHYDGLSATTPTSGHVLDADGRFTKMVEVAVRVLRRIVTLMLAKHERVHLILAEGNHDIAGSVWLRTMFKALYENEPRITVDDSALPYYAFEFGDVSLFFHHSHLRKFTEFGRLIPAQFPEIWGRTKRRYAHTGNLHHERSKDEAGLVIVQHPTLAARDAYAARGMWHALRSMAATTYHRKLGKVGEVTVCPEMMDVAA